MSISADTERRMKAALTHPGAAKEVVDALNGTTTVTTSTVTTANIATLNVSTKVKLPAQDALTALVGGAKAGATQLNYEINRVVTVASAADSVLLPAALAGSRVIVINANVSNAVAVFAAGTDIINALSAATAFSVAATKTCIFHCAVDGKWNTMLTA